MTQQREISERELALLAVLSEDKIPFMIVGMSAALLQGAIGMTQDIDLWIKGIPSPEFTAAIKKIGATYLPPNIYINPPMPAMFFGEGLDQVDLVYSPAGLLTFDEEYKNAKLIDLDGISVKVLPLDRVIASKEFVGRPKDKMALPGLRAALKVQDSTDE